MIETICHIYQQEHLYHFAFIDELNEELLMNLFKEWSKIYPIDGIVIYIDDLRLWEVIGRHQTSGNPLYAIAYKHPVLQNLLRLRLRILYGKSARLVPLNLWSILKWLIQEIVTWRILLDTMLAGLMTMKLQKGAEILVTRSGGVIPKILSTLTPATQEEQEN